LIEDTSGEKGDILLFLPLPWPSTGAEGRFEAEAGGGATLPNGPAEGAAAIEALSQGVQLGRRLRLVHPTEPVVRTRHRSVGHDGSFHLLRRRADRRPRPPVGLADRQRLRPDRIPLDVTQHGQQVVVIVLMKYLGPPIATIHHVVTRPPGRCSSSSWHGPSLAKSEGDGKKSRMSPFIYAFIYAVDWPAGKSRPKRFRAEYHLPSLGSG